MDHYRFPRNRGTIEKPTFCHDELNPSCGDKISMSGIVKDGVLTKVAFTGTGCVISQAAASMLTEEVVGKAVVDIQELSGDLVKELVGLPMGPTRFKCALLSLQVLQHGLRDSLSNS
jgi:nitrogen fixation NifU-like protein